MRYIYKFFFLLIFLSGCADLELTPDGSNTSENLFQTERDAEAAVNAMYASMQTHDVYNQFMEVIQSQGTDDAEWGFGRNTGNVNKLQMDKFEFDASSQLIYRFWENHYKNINRTNIVIEKVGGMDINPDKKEQYVGEAYFLRGLMYFNLVRLFGDVPLKITSTEILENLEIARSPAAEVYEQIASDLLKAKEMLPLTYSAEDLGRPTKGAAMSLLTKMYLTSKQYQKAVEEAEAVIGLGIYELWPTYAAVFDIANENKGESIFEIQYKSTGGVSASVSSSYAGFFRPSAAVLPPKEGEFAGYGDNPVTENHYLAYSSDDPRRSVNVLHVPGAPASIQYPYYVNKYQDPMATTVDDGGNNYYILRYADVLLMYAEALNELGAGNPLAYEAFNKVRRRAYGLPVNAPSPKDLPAGLSQEQFLDSLMNERRLEFAFEGQRRFDLMRWGKLKEAMAEQDPTIMVRDRYLLFPIPEDERIVNSLLTQNPGY